MLKAHEERSPLLKVMERSFQEETYQSTVDTGRPYLTNESMHAFRPIVYAEKALNGLLNGVMMYALCCVVGLALVALNGETLLGQNKINWWIIFIPFWIANAIIFMAHLRSMKAATKLRQWAETDCVSNEPLLPLLRKILLIYAVSVPLSILLLWSQLAFCSLLESTNTATSIYVSYAPLLIIQAGCVIRYLLCKSHNTLPVQFACYY